MAQFVHLLYDGTLPYRISHRMPMFAEKVEEPLAVVPATADHLPSPRSDISEADHADIINWKDVPDDWTGIEVVLDADDDDDDDDDDDEDDDDKIQPLSPQLPAGWKEVFDPNHQRTYFFNELTHQSQWDSPVAAVQLPDIGLENSTIRRLSKKEKAVRRESAKLLVRCPEGHIARFYESGAEAYGLTGVSLVKVGCDRCRNDEPDEAALGFFHCAQCRYDVCLPCSRAAAEPPVGSPVIPPPTTQPVHQQNQTASVRSSFRASINGTLPPNWQEAIDPATRRTYYYHQQTMASQWERPKIKKAVKIKSFFKTIEMKFEPPELPPGWRPVLDEASGKVYYWHDAKGSSSWTIPDF